MCCDPKEARSGLDCCCVTESCCAPGHMVRRFRSSKEDVERLEAYKAELKKEISGVEERIQELKRK
jgi:hypothetical protein